MIFALAGTDVTRIEHILDTPIREVCMVYISHLREHAERDYERSLMVWSNQSAFSKAKAPEIPDILR